jgi:hypothetical protein
MIDKRARSEQLPSGEEGEEKAEERKNNVFLEEDTDPLKCTGSNR